MKLLTRPNLAAACVVAGLAIALLGRPVTRLIRVRRAAFGTRPLTTENRASDLAGRPHMLLAADSMTLLVMLDAKDMHSRSNLRMYAPLAQWGRLQGLASRFVVPNDTVAFAQFARLAGDKLEVLQASPAWYTKIGVTAVPTFLLLDASGAVRGRWVGDAPPHLELLNVMTRARS